MLSACAEGRWVQPAKSEAEAQRAAEFGTSFGVSTIYLAAAVRDNAQGGSRGVVIGTEIERVAPQLHPGAIVMADNVPKRPSGYRDYFDYVRNPANGFRSMRWPGQGGLELSVRVA